MKIDTLAYMHIDIQLIIVLLCYPSIVIRVALFIVRHVHCIPHSDFTNQLVAHM